MARDTEPELREVGNWVGLNRRPRLLFADQNTLLLEGLSTLLRNEWEIAGTVSDGYAAIEAVERLRPDLIVTDVSLPLLNGVEMTRQIRKGFPNTKVLFLTMRDDRMWVEDAFRAGGLGYVLKQAGLPELSSAMTAVLCGRKYLSSRIGIDVNRLEFSLTNRHFGEGLTKRQREVLQLLAEGKSMKEIAWVLKLSVRTIEFHKQSLFQDLGARSTAQLIRYAVDQRIVF